MKYLVEWKAVKSGFFSDTEYSGTDLVEANSKEEAYLDRDNYAKSHSEAGVVIFTVLGVKEL